MGAPYLIHPLIYTNSLPASIQIFLQNCRTVPCSPRGPLCHSFPGYSFELADLLPYPQCLIKLHRAVLDICSPPLLFHSLPLGLPRYLLCSWPANCYLFSTEPPCHSSLQSKSSTVFCKLLAETTNFDNTQVENNIDNT